MVHLLNRLIDLFDQLLSYIRGETNEKPAIKRYHPEPTIETVFDGTVAGNGGTEGPIDLEITDESEIWVLVNTDQPNWSLRGGYEVSPTGQTTEVFFPKYEEHNQSYSNQFVPARSLFMGLWPTGLMSAPNNIHEAKELIVYPVNQRIFFRNHNTEEANVVIRIIRKWN